MKAEGLEKLFLERLHMELQVFKDFVLSQTKEKIFESSYKIEFYVNTYEILSEDAGNLKEGTIRSMLYMDFSILEFLYMEWLAYDDGILDGLRGYIRSEIESITKPDSTITLQEGRYRWKKIS